MVQRRRLKTLNLAACLALYLCIGANSDKLTWDPNGYIMYCPCMGRLGNQVEEFLGSLRFAKNLNRTMVVPPWIAYDRLASTSFTPYDMWFNINELKKFHRVVLMHDFMDQLAPRYWPDDGKSRKIYCATLAAERSPDFTCPAKIGNPFGPFWDSFGIDFTGGSKLYHGGGFDNTKSYWDELFPLDENPVLTFMGAPGAFPVKEENRVLQKYVKWSDKLLSKAKKFIQANMKRPFLGIHLRNGIDWVRACKHIDGDNKFMGSAQCCGYDRRTARKLTTEMCLPPKSAIMDKVQEVAKLHNITHLFIATDNDPMLGDFARTSLKVVRYPQDYPIIDLALLTMADAFIGNCVSTFTSFVVRQREVEQKVNYFFAFDHEHPRITHDDL